MRTEALCSSCEAPHACADACCVDPLDTRHLAEIRRLDGEVAKLRDLLRRALDRSTPSEEEEMRRFVEHGEEIKRLGGIA